jgi:hypothetical protein
MPAPLTVRVNDDLTLDAGTCEEFAGPECFGAGEN